MIEQVARVSAEELRAVTTSDIDAGLADLHVRQARHGRRTRLGAVAAVVLAVGLGWGAGAALTDRGHRSVAPTHPAPSASPSFFHFPCSVSRVTCLGHRTYQFDLARPVRWRIPPGFQLAIDGGVSPLEVRGVRPDEQAGVRVLEQVRASSPDGAHPASGVADDPHAFVDWVASRPFVHAGPVVRTELDGRPAWRVQVTPAPGAGPGRRLCGGYHCHLLTYQPDTSAAGINPGMVAELTAVHLSGAGTTVVWSWSFTGDTRDFSLLHQAVEGLSWPAG
jgi:hypothetical protein